MLTEKAKAYFDRVDATYQSNLIADKPSNAGMTCDEEIMKAMLEANRALRSADIDIDVVSTKPGNFFNDYSDLINFVNEKIKKIPDDGHLRTQVMVNDLGHFYILDLKLSQTSKECILLDAAGDTRATMANMRLSQKIEFDNFYITMPDKDNDTVLPENQKDFHSCPFLSLYQGAELSKIDIYDHLDSLNLTSEYGFKSCNWDILPPQLSVYAQRSEETMQRAQERFAEINDDDLPQGYITSEAFGERLQGNMDMVRGQSANIGIIEFARTVCEKTMDLIQSQQATKQTSQTLDETQQAQTRALSNPDKSSKYIDFKKSVGTITEKQNQETSTPKDRPKMK